MLVTGGEIGVLVLGVVMLGVVILGVVMIGRFGVISSGKMSVVPGSVT